MQLTPLQGPLPAHTQTHWLGLRPAPYLCRVLKSEYRGYSIVFQVLSVPKGAEALGSEVFRADDCVLLGLEVSPAHVEHPLPQQLRAAERKPVGTASNGTALETQ